jgi:F420-dependent oxidoreductase-like protein
MRFGLDIAQHQLSWDEQVRRTRFAEDLGFDGAWVFDHFKALYADPKGPCFEGWSLLAALAAVTTRVRLGTLVTGMTYRHPSILATQAVTVDHISGGRLELAVGAAWFEQEHGELGIPFPPAGERVERLDEGVQVLDLLMTRDDASFDGKHFRLDGATYRPRPVQRPRIPIWIGGSGEKRMLPLVARRADAWHSYGQVGELRRKSEIVTREAEASGRDPADILRAADVSLEDLGPARGRIEQLRDAGFGYLTVGWPSQGAGRVEEFASKLMPEFAGPE